ncbi:MAG: hypothetical protein IJO26_02875 [Clostridium sp.]|nr:hypothetical protein [Clostridium sp.]
MLNKSNISWKYLNKIVSKILDSIGSFLFIINTLGLLMFRKELFIIILMINLVIVVFSKVIIDKLIKRNLVRLD